MGEKNKTNKPHTHTHSMQVVTFSKISYKEETNQDNEPSAYVFTTLATQENNVAASGNR